VLEVAGLGRAAFAILANADPYTYAGSLPLHAAPLARLEEGLDVVAPVRLRPGSIARIVGHLLRGRGLERARGVLYGHDLDRVEIVCDRPLPLQVDGEDLGDVERLEAVCERGALDVLV
jgi:diacylglycerol kinase family enzyme